MKHWWELADAAPAAKRQKAVAYYRHSAQDRQENSIPIQQEQVQAWAKEQHVDIIAEFADAGKSGLTAEGRPAFNDLMDNWVKQRQDFDYVLCLDVSRFGRFQDIDLSAQYSAECRKHGKQVIYTTIGKPRENDPLYPVYVQFERFRAAQYSKELSDKVWRGCVKISEQGYWAGGSPPYGLQRLLLDEKRAPVQVLEPGQRKSIQNQRITLTEGEEDKVAVIRRIFHEFIDLGYAPERIAKGLNDDGILSPGGKLWTASMVRDRLANEKYAGAIVYNRTTQKLKSKRRPNPVEQWVRTPEAYAGIISTEDFSKARELLDRRRRLYARETMLGQLQEMYQQHGLCRSSLLRTPTAATFAHRFGSLDQAFQETFRAERDQIRKIVQEQIRQQSAEVLSYADFLVLDQKLTVCIQPAVPMTLGYATYWPFQPDRRDVIDLTLGVLLSEPSECAILGYVALPRFLAPEHLRIFADSTPTELFAVDLTFLQQLLNP